MKAKITLSNAKVVALVGLLLLLFPELARANQPPGPQLLLAEVLILPLMIFFTILGGGYAILKAQGLKPRWKWPLKIFLAIVMIVVSGAHEGYGTLVTIVFGIIALDRGAKMLRWGIKSIKTGEPEPYLAEAKPVRLITAGVLLTVVAVVLGGAGPAFIGWWPKENRVASELKDLVAYQLVKAKETAAENQAPRYQPPLVDKRSPNQVQFQGMELNLYYHGNRFRPYGVEFKLGPDAKSFKVWATPNHFPFFPYNYLVSLPSFYADQTGVIRMIRVNRNGQKCPENAPQYDKITEGDLSVVAKRIRPTEAPASP